MCWRIQPARTAQYAAAAITPGPRAAIGGRAVIVCIGTIIGPFNDIADQVVHAEGIGLKACNRAGKHKCVIAFDRWKTRKLRERALV